MRPLHLWIGVAVVAVAVVATWLILTNHGTSSSANGAPVASNTIGAYADLVARADNHFQQGMNLISGGNMGSAAPYFVAAGQEYGAAWAQQSTDPAVAGNYATSVFYAGDPQGALILANKALKLHPTGQLLQTILFNKGNYLAMIGRQQVTSGKAVEGRKSLAAAKVSYLAAIGIDSKSTLAQSAQTAIAGLSKTKPSSPATSPSP